MIEIPENRHAEPHKDIIAIRDATNNMREVHKDEVPSNFLGSATSLSGRLKTGERLGRQRTVDSCRGKQA